MGTPPPNNSLARNLGSFFGHLWHAVKTDPSADRRTLHHEVHEHTEPAPGGSVTVRRTTTEEIEYTPRQRG